MEQTFLVKAPRGTFLGKRDSQGLTVFKGIIFGRAARWEKAIMAERKEEIQNAAGAAVDPPQPKGDHSTQREDVLCLNIYINPKGKEPKAVLVHTPVGGGVNSLSDRNDPSRFILEHPDVMVVTANSRVGIFSCLNMSEFEDAAEYGDRFRYSNNLIKTDFNLALEWVKENISAFGGDPENVTVTGHSAGSVTVQSLFYMKESRGLFSKAILRSSFAMDDMIMKYDESLYYAKKFREYAGVSTIREVLELSAEKLLEVQGRITQLKGGQRDGDFPGKVAPPFSTVIDNVTVFDSYFQDMIDRAKEITLMVGCTDGEADMRLAGRSNEENYDLISTAKYAKFDPERGGWLDLKAVTDAYIRRGYELYQRSEEFSYRDLYNDLFMRSATVMLSEIFSRESKAYLYHFGYAMDNPKKLRAAHGAAEKAAWGMLSDVPEHMAKTVRDCYASFIQYGDPNEGNESFAVSASDIERNPFRESVAWKAYDSAHPYTLFYDNSGVRLVEGVRHEEAMESLKNMREYPLFIEYLSKSV